MYFGRKIVLSHLGLSYLKLEAVISLKLITIFRTTRHPDREGYYQHFYRHECFKCRIYTSLWSQETRLFKYFKIIFILSKNLEHGFDMKRLERCVTFRHLTSLE
jgi:hypothetical protein